MNIFFLSNYPREAAKALDDKRLRRQMQEATHLLCSWLAWQGDTNVPWKPCPMPNTIKDWLQSTQSVVWLNRLCFEMRNELMCRFGAMIEYYKQVQVYDEIKERLPVGRIVGTQLFNHTRSLVQGLDFTSEKSPVIAYRRYIDAKWALDVNRPVWTNRRPPTWKRSTHPHD